MKTISLWQPWATLIAIEAKHCETRSWGTPYRGMMAIHAAKNVSELPVCNQPVFRRVLEKEGYLIWNTLPLGAIVAIGELVDCFQMTPAIIAQQSDQERAFGDWKPGRYGWLFVNVRRVKPFPYRGAQGLFDAELPAVLESEVTS